MELILTEDGSHTIYLEEIDETYHSRHGAIQESMHVFIKNGLRYFLSCSGKKNVRIFELGLGTGLNVLLTSFEAIKFKYFIHYLAIEPFPLPPKMYTKLNYANFTVDKKSNQILNRIHEAEWNKEIQLNEFFTLFKEKLSFENYPVRENKFDIIYYDAFAPNKQPAIWDIHLLKQAYYMLVKDGILVTYCSQGNFKSNLKYLGFKVENLQGPPGKKEMVRAIK